MILCRRGLKLDRDGTHRLLRLLNTGFNLLKSALDLIVDNVDLLFPYDGNRGLGSELLRARPPHSPVPSHTILGARVGEGPWEKCPNIGIKRKPWSWEIA